MHIPREITPLTDEQRDLIDADAVEFASNLAKKLTKNHPKHSRQEVISAAYEGLTQAAQDYDPANWGKAGFKTYAAIRIRGHVLDHLRKEHPRGRRKSEAQVIYYGRPVAGNNGDEFASTRDLVYDACLMITDPAPDFELADAVTDTLKCLPARHKEVMRSLYLDPETNMKKTGQQLGFSESRVSQLHSQSLNYLRERLTQGSP